jgi:hypothetical protein
MSSCDSTNNVNVIITYSVFVTDDCSGTVSTTEISTYPAICTNDVAGYGSYKYACASNPNYVKKGKKDYVSTTCDGLVASYTGYVTEACVANGNSTYNLIYFNDCSVATVSSHIEPDCGDPGTNIMNFPIEADTCHNDVNTDDLIYFDDDVNNGFHWNDKGSIKEYCNSGISIFEFGLISSIWIITTVLNIF